MSNELTRKQYEELVNAYIEEEFESLVASPPTLSLLPTSFSETDTIIDSTFFLELDDDWGRPLPFGWVALDAHFTGLPEQDYYTDLIIEVKYDD